MKHLKCNTCPTQNTVNSITNNVISETELINKKEN